MMTTKLLPMLIAGVLRLWNPNSETIDVTLQCDEWTQTIQIEGYAIQNVSLPSGRVIITGPDSVIAWTTVESVTFTAQAPKLTWEIPADSSVGIAIVGESTQQNQVRFQVSGRAGTFSTTGGMMTGMWAGFISWLFQKDVHGKLIVTADRPIAVFAASCARGCTALPTR